MVQDLGVPVVGEGHVPILHLSPDLLKRLCVRSLPDVRHRLHDGVEPLESGIALLEHLGEIHELGDGRHENADVEAVNGQLPGGQGPPGDEQAAGDNDRGIEHALQKAVAALEQAHGHVAFFLGGPVAPVGGGKLLPLPCLPGKGLHHPDAGQGVLDPGVHVGDPLPVVREDPRHLLLPEGGKDR